MFWIRAFSGFERSAVTACGGTRFAGAVINSFGSKRAVMVAHHRLVFVKMPLRIWCLPADRAFTCRESMPMTPNRCTQLRIRTSAREACAQACLLLRAVERPALGTPGPSLRRFLSPEAIVDRDVFGLLAEFGIQGKHHVGSCLVCVL